MKNKLIAIIVLLVLFLNLNAVAFAAEYEYDNLNRVSKVTYEDGSYVIYTYDANGNITSIIKYTKDGEPGDAANPTIPTTPDSPANPIDPNTPSNPNSPTNPGGMISIGGNVIGVVDPSVIGENEKFKFKPAHIISVEEVWKQKELIDVLYKIALFPNMNDKNLPKIFLDNIKASQQVLEEQKEVTKKVGSVTAIQIMRLLGLGIDK